MKISIELDTLIDELVDVERVLSAVSGQPTLSDVTPIGGMAGETAIVQSVETKPSPQEAFKDVAPVLTDQQKQALAQEAFPPVGNVAPTVVETAPSIDESTNGTLPNTAVAAGVETDDQNYPHHLEIHTKGKTKMGTTGKRAGCWKYKPKTDKALIEQIEAQDRANGYGPQEVGNDPRAMSPTIPQPTEVQSTVPVPQVTPAAIPEVNTTPTPQESAAAMTYLQLFKTIATDTTSGTVPNGVSQHICDDLGVGNPMELNSQPQLVAPFYNQWEKVKALLTLQPQVKDTIVLNWATFRAQGLL